MVGPAEFAAVLSSLKSAKDLTEAMAGLRDVATFQEKRIELQSKILDAQAGALELHQNRTSLIERIRELEQEITNLKNWDADKKRYELKDLSATEGAFAYILKSSCADSEPVHCICATCYARGKKSILQTNGEQTITKHALVCFECKTQVKARLHRH